MSYYCDFPPEFWDEAFPIAAKEHRCCECRHKIQKGERYCYIKGKWDGEFSTFRQHLLCREACMTLRDTLMGGECLLFGELGDEGSKPWTTALDEKPKASKLRQVMARYKYWEKKGRQPSWLPVLSYRASEMHPEIFAGS
jgi:hypothetical protein